jgi:hypothetical protein
LITRASVLFALTQTDGSVYRATKTEEDFFMKKLLLTFSVLLMAATASADRVRGSVVGIGSAGMKPERLFDRGYDMAIFETKACAASGHFSNGARCYAEYESGWTEWVGPVNANMVRSFARRLERARP